MSPRPYRLQQRQADVDATRARITVAAQTTLVSGARFSIEAVARHAGVARITVYDHFGTREALLEGVFDDLARSGGLLNLPEAFLEPDPARALERFVEIFCAFYATHRELLRRLNALAVLGHGAAGHTDRNPRRAQGLRVLLGRLAGSGVPGADDDAVVSAVQALTSFAFFDELSAGHDNPPAVAPLLVQLIWQILLPRHRSRDEQTAGCVDVSPLENGRIQPGMPE
jgi:AcrR family transcriptional regulator